jgi:protein tyrosine phosphatase (PTP) superfamily phosphohydrolase (DUF442 family)
VRRLYCYTAWMLVLFVCAQGAADNQAGSAADASVPAGVHTLEAKGIANYFQLTPEVYSGSSPENDEAFAALQRRGIKTIISVDGARPDVEKARRFGLRYVHLPFGYNGVPADRGLSLVRAAHELPGPIYVHCHHGVHRGPAAAAVICLGIAGWSHEQAEAWLRLAGTSTNYAGLYRSVKEFERPTAAVLKSSPADFPEVSPVSPLADVMVEIDSHVENLKLVKQAGYREPGSHPDVIPPQEALLLDELFKELRRSQDTERRDGDFRVKLEQAEAAADGLHLCLSEKPVDVKRSDAAYQRLSDACIACHRVHRD